jgi:hypothetical protein
LDESSSTTKQFFLFKMDFDGSSNGVSPSKMGSSTKKLEDLPFGNITPYIYNIYILGLFKVIFYFTGKSTMAGESIVNSLLFFWGSLKQIQVINMSISR